MTKRENLRRQLIEKLQGEIGELTGTTSEFTEQYVLTGSVEGKSITATIVCFPGGENPETHGGEQRWAVTLLGDDGEVLDRYHNPEPSLELAFQMINWDRVRDQLNP